MSMKVRMQRQVGMVRGDCEHEVPAARPIKRTGDRKVQMKRVRACDIGESKSTCAGLSRKPIQTRHEPVTIRHSLACVHPAANRALSFISSTPRLPDTRAA